MESNLDYEDEYTRKYLAEMSTKEKKAYEIAKSHLGYSFQVEKSVGFLKWKREFLARDSTTTQY